MNYLAGVHQGDNLVPLLLILVFQASMKSLELMTDCKNIAKPRYKYFPNTKTVKPCGRLAGQSTSEKGKELTYWLSLYVYDSAFILLTREDATKTAKLTLNHLKRFGLQMYTGTSSKKSKTEVLSPQNETTQTTRRI